MPLFSLGSPNTNLPYIVTMETGVACQPYSTDGAFLSAAALALRRLRARTSPSPRVLPSSLEDQGPSEADPLFDLARVGRVV